MADQNNSNLGLETECAQNKPSGDVLSAKIFNRRGFAKLCAGGLLVTLGAAAGATLTTLSGCDFKQAADSAILGKRTITDDAGREVELPTVDKLERIFFTSLAAQIFCFTLAPDLLAGTGVQFTKKELELLPEGTADLPYLGTYSGGAEIDRESLMVEDVQVIFSISGMGIDEMSVDEAVNLSSTTAIPVVIVDGSFENIASGYRLMGQCLGQEDRAEELASYVERVYKEVGEAVAGVPDEGRIRLYYAEGPEGLQTEPSGTEHSFTFDYCKAYNVAKVEAIEGLGMSNVSLEQVFVWDPEVIIAWDYYVRGGADLLIKEDENWAHISAVKDKRVYTMPNTPFSWCDRPPGVNRLIGIQWVANMLYPQLYTVDMLEETKNFYKTFYWVELTDDKALEILGNSYPPYQPD